MRIFGDVDVERQERRTGCFYFVCDDGAMMRPATHVGRKQAAHVSVLRATAATRGAVRWAIYDAVTGELVLRGAESFWSRRTFWHAARRALRCVRGRGCDVRVRPGDRGPWYHV